jgi:hypothetical protein
MIESLLVMESRLVKRREVRGGGGVVVGFPSVILRVLGPGSFGVEKHAIIQYHS